jgi:hypothetical protein
MSVCEQCGCSTAGCALNREITLLVWITLHTVTR